MNSPQLTSAYSWTEAKRAYESGERQFKVFARYPMHPAPGERTCKDCITGASLVDFDHRDNGALVCRCASCRARLKGGKYHVGLTETAPKKDRQFDDYTRWAILKRDRCRCFYCGAGPEDDSLVIDHVIPYCMGGPSTLENGITACQSCNAAKSGRFEVEQVIRVLIYTHLTDDERKNGKPGTVFDVLKRVAVFVKQWETANVTA